MSLYAVMIEAALEPYPKVKGGRCRSMLYEAVGKAAYASIQGAPWTAEVEIALRKLDLAIDAAIDADPLLKEIFDELRPAHPPLGDDIQF